MLKVTACWVIVLCSWARHFTLTARLPLVRTGQPVLNVKWATQRNATQLLAQFDKILGGGGGGGGL